MCANHVSTIRRRRIPRTECACCDLRGYSPGKKSGTGKVVDVQVLSVDVEDGEGAAVLFCMVRCLILEGKDESRQAQQQSRRDTAFDEEIIYKYVDLKYWVVINLMRIRKTKQTAPLV